MATSKVRSSNQVFIDEDLDMRVHKIKQLTAGTATGHGVEYDQLNTAIKNAVDPILATIHAPTADLTAAKAIASAARANAQTMLIETLGLYWYDADNAAASNDDTIIRPGDIASDLTVGRWVRHYQTKLYQPNGTNPFVYTDNSGQLHIDGNIIQNGAAYETHAEHVYTTKDQIILRDGAIAGLANGAYAGFKAKLYDGVNDGYLIFDNTGTARVGDAGSEQPIATRIESPTAGHYAIWDGANSRLNFVAPNAISAGVAANYIFCDDVVFGGTSPVWHELEKQSDGGTAGSHTATGTSYSELDRYVTPALNTSMVPEGLWNFTLFASMSAHTGKIKIELYRVNSSGTIVGNVLGSAETPEFGNTTVNPVYASVFIAEQTGWALTDRIGVVLSGKRYTGTATLTYWHNLANGYVSEMSSPLSLLHNQMSGLNLGDYVHLTAAQAANLVGTAQYQIPVTGATTFTPSWTNAANLIGASGLNSLSYSAASFVKMTAANTFALRTMAETLSDLGAAAASGSSNYIQNQNAAAQTANIWVSGDLYLGGINNNSFRFYGNYSGGNAGFNLYNGSGVISFWHNSNVGGTFSKEYFRTKVYESTVETGTAPLSVASTTVVTNLNSEIWAGYKHGFAQGTSDWGNLDGIIGIHTNGYIYRFSAPSVNAFLGTHTGSGTSGQVAFWTGTSTQSGNDGLLWDNVNKKLEVSRVSSDRTELSTLLTLNSSGDSPYTGFGGKISFNSNIYTTPGQIETGYIGVVMGSPYATESDIVFATRGNSTLSQKMRILGNGNLGLGYIDPGAYKIKVNGSGYFNTDIISGSLAGTGNRSVYVDANGKLCASAAGSGLAGNRVYRATPSGTINGTNPTFTITGVTIVTGSEEVFKNGVLMNSGSGNDYTIAVSSGNTIITFETGSIPNTTGGNDVLLVNYTPQ